MNIGHYLFILYCGHFCCNPSLVKEVSFKVTDYDLVKTISEAD